ncbi:MAG TPA: S8 family peptidase [Gammaproteobacteria bacterium]|nr:S8 family peptidase [Gammaproteobacteria bacterium]
MSQSNFLIGRGELLTYPIRAPKGGGEKAEVYTFYEAREVLRPQFNTASANFDTLSEAACPQDMVVARMTLNPGYIAKSYFPSTLLRSVNLESVGSRTVQITPRKWTKKGTPELSSTTELFIAGQRSTFRDIAAWMNDVLPESREAIDLAHIEMFASYEPEERLHLSDDADLRFYEVGIHLLPNEQNFVQSAFIDYAEQLGVTVYTDLSFRAGSLWFLPVECDLNVLKLLSVFTFIRVVRPVPKLRGLRPALRTSGISVGCDLPVEQPLSSEPKVAILDGGLPEEHPIATWLGAYRELDPGADADSEGTEHGLAVTSAFLFGPIEPNTAAARPYSYVDHVRVLDADSNTEDPLELYRTLGFVEQVLLSRQYEFINLSLGPDLPIEDIDVHAWTSVIDDLLSDGDTFMTVAVGNNGERDHASGNARVQVPSDCVNAVAVGAANSENDDWARAGYSAMGPGRSPGVVKPDLMAFGGDATGYFHVLHPNASPSLEPQLGTSFASPYLLRSAVGIRAILGSDLTPLAVKALLVNSADQSIHHIHDVGWGKVPVDLMEIITCPSGVARIVYQGELKPGKYLRANIPLPDGGLNGRVKLKATFCYACPVDPQDASAYTRAGLDIVFRPNSTRVKAGKSNADSKSFFTARKYATEQERRSDTGKWETVLHNEKGMLGSSLHEPLFDIHYNAREGAGKTNAADKIRYALIITVEALKHEDLYNDILRAYANILTPIQPQVSLPVRT